MQNLHNNKNNSNCITGLQDTLELKYTHFYSSYRTNWNIFYSSLCMHMYVAYIGLATVVHFVSFLSA